MRRLAFGAVLFALAVQPSRAPADEGMWLFNGFPAKTVAKKYGFEPDAKWLDHVRRSSARTGGGCSASFVSKDGLVMTNHHCVHDCIEQLSSAKKDYVKDGFQAKTLADEAKCPELEIDELTDITDVTEVVTSATKGLEGKGFADARKATIAKLEKDCSGGSAALRCDVVNLYRGGKYDLYKYHRFEDVRVVFVPEFAIAFFGGDPDNFNFPRFDLDVSFVRIYENGKPAQPDDHFRWSKKNAKEGDLVFTSGTPGRTSRLNTMAKLSYEREVRLPKILFYYEEYRGRIAEFQKRGAEQKRFSNATFFYVENGVKALKGRLFALDDATFWNQKLGDENALRQKVLMNDKMRTAYYPAWDAIAHAQTELRKIGDRYQYLEQKYGFRSELFTFARQLVRAGEELGKPNEKRLQEYADARIPGLKQQLFSSAPIFKEFEMFTLAFSLEKLREELGTDDPFVKKVLGKESPEQLARRVIEGSKLDDLAVRKQLFEGGKKAIDASTDPLLELVRRIDPDARSVRKDYEDKVDAVETKNGELLARARFEVYGTSIYPDATGSHRLSFGTIKGFPDAGKLVKPITTFGGAFERHTGQDPFALPASWMAAKAKLDLSTPFNFASDNDIIGGNSGSPVVNKDAEIVGLIFDGNIQSLGGDYGFDSTVNRAVSVHSAALLEALGKIYGATRVVEELRAP